MNARQELQIFLDKHQEVVKEAQKIIYGLSEVYGVAFHQANWAAAACLAPVEVRLLAYQVLFNNKPVEDANAIIRAQEKEWLHKHHLEHDAKFKAAAMEPGEL